MVFLSCEMPLINCPCDCELRRIQESNSKKMNLLSIVVKYATTINSNIKDEKYQKHKESKYAKSQQPSRMYSPQARPPNFVIIQ